MIDELTVATICPLQYVVKDELAVATICSLRYSVADGLRVATVLLVAIIFQCRAGGCDFYHCDMVSL